LAATPAAAFARFGDRTLHTGSSGHDVKVLQSWLSHMGFDTSIDGSFGRNTRWNVRRFEQAKRLRINGVLTRSDAEVMRHAMAAPYSFAGDDPSETGTPTTPGSKATMSGGFSTRTPSEVGLNRTAGRPSVPSVPPLPVVTRIWRRQIGMVSNAVAAWARDGTTPTTVVAIPRPTAAVANIV